MPLTRYLPVLLLVLLLASFVSAISISAENDISKATPWTFSVDYALSAGNDLKVFVDSELAFVLFEHGGLIYVSDAQKSSKVLSYSNASNKLSISYVGMSEGTHTIAAKILSGSTVLDETTKEVSFFTPLTSAERDTLQDNIDALQTTISSQSSTISSLNNELSSKQKEIDSLKSDNSRLGAVVNTLSEDLSSLEEKGSLTEEELGKVKYDLNELMYEREQAKKSPFAGLFAFGSENSFPLTLLVIVAAIIVIALFVFKYKGDSIYSKPLLSKKSEFDSGLKDSELPSMQKEDPLGGKWAFAFGSFGRKKAPEGVVIPERRGPPTAEKKFGYSELMKK